jgi:hypothetical protein
MDFGGTRVEEEEAIVEGDLGIKVYLESEEMMRNFFEKGSLESERVWEMKVKSV